MALPQLDPNRFSAPAAKPRELMRDGKWMVPPEERPKDWERYGLAEIEESAPTVSRRADGNFDWTGLVVQLVRLKCGHSLPVRRPDDVSLDQFAATARSALAQSKTAAVFRWGIRAHADDPQYVIITKKSAWVSARGIVLDQQNEGEPPLKVHEMERAPQQPANSQSAAEAPAPESEPAATIRFMIDIAVSQEELSKWKTDRLERFFDGVSKILSAKNDAKGGS